MVVGIGCDILKYSRLKEKELLPDSAFVRRTFSASEIEEAEKRESPALYFRTRFCGKEAVFKSLCMDGNTGRFPEIEILCDSCGRPYVKLHGAVKKHAESLNVAQVCVTLSYEDQYAVAYALSQTDKPETGSRAGGNHVGIDE